MSGEAAEQRFEAALEPHREPDGSYACDAHVMLTYAREALACSALEPSMEERIELGARARWSEQNPTVPWEEAGLTMQSLSRASARTVLAAAGVPGLILAATSVPSLLEERDARRERLMAESNEAQVHLPILMQEEFGMARSEARRLIAQGRVRIDGEMVWDMDVEPCDPGRVSIDHAPVLMARRRTR